MAFIDHNEEGIRSHLSFGENCIINNMLPTYRNLKVEDDAAREETLVMELGNQIVERQIEEQKEEIVEDESNLNEDLKDFRNLCEHQKKKVEKIKEIFIKNKCKASQSTASRHHVVYPYY